MEIMRKSFYEFMQKLLHAKHAKNAKAITEEISEDVPSEIFNAITGDIPRDAG